MVTATFRFYEELPFACLLRMMGFDTLDDSGFADDEIERIAAAQAASC